MATPTYNAGGKVEDVDGNNFAQISTLSAAAGSNRLLLVFVMTGAGTPQNHTGVTWGGVALTQRGSTLTIGPYGKLSLWYLNETSFPSGATGLINVSFAGNQDESFIGAVIYQDVDQASPFKNASLTTNSGTNSNSYSITITTDTTSLAVGGAWGIDTGGSVTSISSTAGTTRQEADNVGGLSAETGSVADIAGGASNATISWTAVLGGGLLTDDWGAIGDAVQYSGGGGGTIVKTLAALGVG